MQGPPVGSMLHSPPTNSRAVLEEAVFKVWVAVWACLLGLISPAAGAAAPVGMFTIVEGGDVIVVREAQKFRATEGLRLAVEDIVHVGAKARLARIELADGTTVDLGPGTRLMVQPRSFGPQSARPAQIYLATGWVKATSADATAQAAPAGIASLDFDVLNLQGSAVIHATEDATRVFLESGRAEVAERRNGRALTQHKVRDGQVYARKAEDAGSVRAGAPADWVAQMPRGFMDSLPRRSARFAAVLIEPSAVSEASYADVSSWINGDALLRPGFLQRWGRKASDPQWRAGLVAEMHLHAEWDRLVFPEKYRPKSLPRSEPALAARRSNTLAAPAELVRALGSQAVAAPFGPAIPTAADGPQPVPVRPAGPAPAAATAAPIVPAWEAPAAAPAVPVTAATRPAAPAPAAQADAPSPAPAQAAAAPQAARASAARSDATVPGASPMAERAQ